MRYTHSTLTISTLASLLLLAACDSSTGGGAGDADDGNLVAIELLTPFAGTYDLQDDWRTLDGIAVDQAFLVIAPPGSDGTATVELKDYDDFDNCIIQPPQTGILKKDDFSNAVFLNDMPDFDEAELSLSPDLNTLTIEFNDSELDLNNNGDKFDRLTVVAERFNSDLSPDC